MEQKVPQSEPLSQKASLHQSDADDDDENVKQLNECSSLYLSLQVISFFEVSSKTLNPVHYLL